MLKKKSILKIKQGIKKSRQRAQNNQNEYLKKRDYKNNLLIKEHRRRNSIILTNESEKHAYSKFIVSLVLYKAGYTVLTEYPFRKGEMDVFCPELAIAIEIQNDNSYETVKKKMLKYEELFQSGILNDVFTLNLSKDFKFDLEEDYKKIKEKLGV